MRRAEKHELEEPVDPRLEEFIEALAAALVVDYERSLVAKKQPPPSPPKSKAKVPQ